MLVRCYKCQQEHELPAIISRQEACYKCHADLRCCKMCVHFDTTVYNECRETQAERIVEKDKANFCSYFVVKDNINSPDPLTVKDQILSKAKSLFKN